MKKRNLVKIGSGRYGGLAVGKIFETPDYSLFSWYVENRGHKNHDGLSRNKLRQLQKIYDKGEWVPELAIVKVNAAHVIIDGRHTFQICKNNGMPIRFIFVYDPRFEKRNEKIYVLNNITKINQVNTSWSATDIFKGAEQNDQPLAKFIRREMNRHNNDFTWTELYGLISHSIDAMSGRKRGIGLESFNDDDLMQYIETEEFRKEYNFFIAVNDKVRISYRKHAGLAAIFGVLWFEKDFVIDKGKFKKIATSLSDDFLRSERAGTVPDFIKYMLKLYNSEYGETVNYEALTYKGKFGKAGQVSERKTNGFVLS